MARVSVCIPTFNYGAFLRDALASALAQSFGDLEVVVVDNCSTDDTAAVVEEARRRDPRVRYVRNSENVGAQRNLNRCLELARGEYVNVLGADDLLEPGALARLAAPLERDPGIVLAAGARIVVDARLRPMNRLAFGRRPEVLSGAEAIRRCLGAGNLIGEPSGVLFRREAATRGFDPGFRQLIDVEMWFHLLQRGGFAFVPDPVCRVRRHGGSESTRNVRALEFVGEFIALDAAYGMGDAGRRRLPRGWRLNVALDVWGMLRRGLSLADVHRQIRRVCPLPAFYAALPAGMVRRLSAFARDAWRASRAARPWR